MNCQVSNVNYRGLTEAEVSASRARHGANILTPPAKTPLWVRFLEKFNDPLIIILLVAGGLSVGISCYEFFILAEGLRVFFEPVGIFVAILLATGLSFIFETKAEREFEILNKVNDEEPVQVIRDGKPRLMPKCDVVVGDIVVLATGQEIPADGTLVEAVTLNVDESSLTGEPLCHKTTDESLFDADATYPSNCVLRGTKVMEGHGTMRVDKVGDATENGKVHTEAQIEDGKRTPLNQQFDRLGRLISWTSYAIGVFIMAGRVVAYFAWPSGPFELMEFISYVLQSLMIAVTLVVCSVPEGLPMAVTLSLAYSMRRMLKTSNLVRKMHACETMGATTVICTDKTGTLTQNRMTVIHVECDDRPALYECMAVNSTAMLDAAGQPIGNPTEGALLLWLRSQDVDYETLRACAHRLSEEPFNTERKYMAVTIANGVHGQETRYVKGAPEIVAAMCGCEVPAVVAQWQSQAMRTLAFAANGQWLGCCAISDPVRGDVPAAVDECRKAGIEIKIVTGDTPGTALEIARQIGLVDNPLPSEPTQENLSKLQTPPSKPQTVITGPEFAVLTDDELLERVASIRIIARARPMDKKRLVEALQKRGEVVAVTGDGTNDAPALKAAHVGLSMGDGTSVAKDASDITIIDNSFASIGRAVLWGRSLYQNIQRFILFQMTINVVACLVVLAGAFMDTKSPLTVTQMLWVNLIMDTFAAMALASLPPNPAVMKRKPRKQTDFIIDRDMARNIIGVGLLFAALLIGLLYRMQHVQSADLIDVFTSPAAPHGHLTTHELSLFFTIFVMLQFWNMFNARAFATGRSALHLRGCKGFTFIASLIIIGQMTIVHLMPDFFNVEPLEWYEWWLIIIGTSPVLWIGELMRKRGACGGLARIIKD